MYHLCVDDTFSDLRTAATLRVPGMYINGCLVCDCACT